MGQNLTTSIWEIFKWKTENKQINNVNVNNIYNTPTTINNIIKNKIENNKINAINMESTYKNPMWLDTKTHKIWNKDELTKKMWWFVPEGIKETLDWWMVNLTNLKNDEWFFDCNQNITASNVYVTDR
jgi:hypothetical protein